jgi:twitching motility protein PilT
MAALDKILGAMTACNAHRLTFRAGEIPQFHTDEGTRPVLKAPLGETALLTYIKELADSSVADLMDRRQPCSFLYNDYSFSIAFEGGLAATVEPAGAPSGRTEPTHSQPGSHSARRPKVFQNKIDVLLYTLAERNASDLHLCVGEAPYVRVDGAMSPIVGRDPLTQELLEELLWPICPEKNRKEFEARHDTDFAYEIEGLARYRCNYYMDRRGMGAVFRQIPSEIPTIEQIGIPQQVVDLCWLSKGLVLVTGPTGSGKSTTLAALVDFINQNRTDHIITIEDPIEFVHSSRKCLVNQRQVGVHTESFKKALRAALREDPDIVMVGEMRDLETIAIAIETAETGHLVFGTLHTTTAPSTIDRVIDQFPPDQQAQIRVMLSDSLRGVISQNLCKKVGGGRVAVLEILLINASMSNLIREGKTFQIPSIMQTQKAQGNVTLNDALFGLVKQGLVDPREAYVKSVDKAGLRTMYERNKIEFDLDKPT